jgi:hypothetical protein
VLFFGTNNFIPDFIQAAFLGLTGAVIYLLATILTGKRIIGLCAAFLFSFSIPTLGFTWVLLNKQPAVSLVIVLGLLGYVHYVKTGSRKWLYVFWASCMVGPLLRELTVILPLTALFETLVERRKDLRLLISLPLLTLFGFFPSFLPNLILFGRVVLLSTLSRGYSAAQIGTTGSGLGGLRYEMPYVLFLFLPYILTILGVLSIAFLIAGTKRLSKKLSLALSIGFLVLGLVTLGLFPIFVPRYVPNEINIWVFLPSILVLIIVAATFTISRLLSIWFLISFLPFYKLYTLDVHLAPAAIAWIIIILLWISRLPAFGRGVSNIGLVSVKNRKQALRFVRFLFIAIMILGIAQQSSNLYAVYSTFGGMTSEVQAMSSLLSNNSSSASLVIVNFPHGGLISLYTNGKVENVEPEHFLDNLPFLA